MSNIELYMLLNMDKNKLYTYWEIKNIFKNNEFHYHYQITYNDNEIYSDLHTNVDYKENIYKFIKPLLYSFYSFNKNDTDKIKNNLDYLCDDNNNSSEIIYQFLPKKDLIDNPDYMLFCIKLSTKMFKYASPRIKNSDAFILKYLEYIENIKDYYKTEFYKVYNGSFYILSQVGIEKKNNFNIINRFLNLDEEMVSKDNFYLKIKTLYNKNILFDIDMSLLNDKKIVNRCFDYLRNMRKLENNKFKDNSIIWYNFIGKDVKKDTETIENCIDSNGLTIKYIPDHLLTKKLILKALKKKTLSADENYYYDENYSCILNHIPLKFLDYDIIINALRKNSDNYFCLDDKLKKNNYYIIEAMKYCQHKYNKFYPISNVHELSMREKNILNYNKKKEILKHSGYSIENIPLDIKKLLVTSIDTHVIIDHIGPYIFTQRNVRRKMY